MHALCVAEIIRNERDQPCIIWDAASLPETSTISFDPEQVRALITPPDAPEINLGTCGAIWWRRPQAHKIDDAVTDEQVAGYCRAETDRLFKGLFTALETPILNHPDKQGAASRKPYQLHVAQAAGLRIPRTLMTNHKDAAVAFCAAQPTIYKAFQSPSWRMVETRRITDDSLAYLTTLRHAPVILQECIPLGRDLRVTVVRDRVFAAAASGDTPQADVDWRIDFSTRWETVQLDDDLIAAIHVFMERLGLDYGCLDFREGPNGETYFLEVNPSGQFMFIEVDTGQPILRAMADMLCNPGPVRPS